MTQNRIYLDWNATTPLRVEARDALVAALDVVGNPSSVHGDGRKARRLMEDARQVLAQALDADPRNVVFTSGGTEANVLALSPELKARSGNPVTRLLVSAVEHASVLAGGRFAPDAIETVNVTSDGVVDLAHLERLLTDPRPTVLSLMAANNETGAIQPVAEAAALVHAAGGLLHVDAVQAFGKIPISIKALQADLVSVSAHKIGGPKGVGALVYADSGTALGALISGGGQEQGRRAGTENVPGIAAFGAAVKAAVAGLAAERPRVQELRDLLADGLKATPGLVVFADTLPRLPNTVLFAVPGLSSETVVISFDLAGISVASGSACSSGKVKPSHVLVAMGFPEELSKSGIRLSLGWLSTKEDVVRCLEAWRKLSGTLLKHSDETLLERF